MKLYFFIRKNDNDRLKKRMVLRFVKIFLLCELL